MIEIDGIDQIEKLMKLGNGAPLPDPTTRPLKDGESRDNGDGSHSTELTITVETPHGYMLIPSMWMTPDGIHELTSEESLSAAQRYEAATGQKFPMFRTESHATEFAIARSERGGALQEPLARPTGAPQFFPDAEDFAPRTETFVNYDPDQPGTMETLSAGFRLESPIHAIAEMTAGAITNEVLTDPDEHFDPNFDVTKYPEWKNQPLSYMGVRSRQELRDRKNILGRVEQDNATIAAAGVDGMAAVMIGGLLDPLIAVGAGPILARNIAKGSKAAKAGAIGVVAAPPVGAEAILQLNEPGRDTGQIVTAGILSATFATVLAPFLLRGGKMTAAEVNAGLNKIDNELHDAEVAASSGRSAPAKAGKEGTGDSTPPSSGGREAESAGAAARPGVTFENAGAELTGESLVTALGLEKLPDSPFKRLLVSPSLMARQMTSSLIESPGLYLNKHLRGEANPLSVETNIRLLQYPLVEVLDTMLDQYLIMRGKGGAGSTRNMIELGKISIMDRLNGTRNKGTPGDGSLPHQRTSQSREVEVPFQDTPMGYVEFREQVTDALRAGDVHENPHVQKAAKKTRELINKLRDDALENDLFTVDLRQQRRKADVEARQAEQRIVEQEAHIDDLRRQAIEERKARKAADDERGGPPPDTEEIARLRAAAQKEFDADPEKFRNLGPDRQAHMGPAHKALAEALEKNRIGPIEQKLNKAEASFGGLKAKSVAAKRRASTLETQLKHRVDEVSTMKKNTGYVPRIWRVDKIDANTEGFRKILSDHLTRMGVAPEHLAAEVEQMLARVRRDTPFAALDSDLTGIARSARARSLEIPDELVRDFIENDIDAIMRHHVRTFGTDLELAKRFDSVDLAEQIQLIEDDWAELIQNAAPDLRSDLIKQKNANLRDFRALRDRLRGTYGLPNDPYRPLSRFYRIMKEWNYLTYLGGVVISALPDLIRPIMTEGFTRTMKHGLKPLLQSVKNLDAHSIETMRAGTALDMVLNQRALAFAELTDVWGQQSKLERVLHSSSAVFSMMNLLNPWNATMKQFSGMIVASRILETSEAWTGVSKISPEDMAKLARTGIDQPMAIRLSTEFKKHGDIIFNDGTTMRELLEAQPKAEHTRMIREMMERGRIEGGLFMPNTANWTDDVATNHFRGALSQEVDKTIVTPGAADRPLWMSTELGSVVGQFKAFAVSATHRVLMSGLQEKQSHTAMGALGLIGMGILAHEIKKVVRGDDKDENIQSKILSGVDRSGVMGWFTDANRAIETLSGNNVSLEAMVGAGKPYSPGLRQIASTIGGPTGSKLTDMHLVLSDVTGHGSSDRGASAARRLMIGQNLFYMSGIFDALEGKR